MGRGATGLGPGPGPGLRFYSSEGVAVKVDTPAQKPADGLDLDDVPEQGSLAPLSQRAQFRKYLDDVEEDDYPYEPGAPDNRRLALPGIPYTTALPRKKNAAIEIEQAQDEDLADRTVHVLGTDPRALYVAHRLAGYEYLRPVKLLINKKIIMNNWEREGKRLLVLKGDKRSIRNRAEAEWIGRGANLPSSEHITQLIVTLPCWETRAAIHNIRHRIDNRTTICLIQDGLGVVEELNATLFQDPTTRPHYILGHMAASLGYHKQIYFSSILRAPGRLYLTALERGIRLPSFFKFHPPVERRPNAVKFMRTLAATDGLGAGGYSHENYLVKKLPEMVFQCIVEPIAIAIDATYDRVLRNEYAVVLADELLEEVFNVVWALPELTSSPKLLETCGMDALRRYTLDRLLDKGTSQSQLLSSVRAGKTVDIDYLNGYFVRRAKELGIKTPQNEMMIGAVKARIEERRKQLRGLVPFEGLATPSHSLY